MNLIEICEKWCLTQKVSESTRLERILDLVLTSEDDIIEDIKHIRHEKLSDHDTMIINLSNINDVKDKKFEEKKNYCTTKIPEYKTDNFTGEVFDKISDELKNKCWVNVTPESLTEFIEELIVNNCELKNPIKKTSDGKSFKSNAKIPRSVR